MSKDKKERRGLQLTISNEHFSNLIADALHLPVGSIRVHHVTDARHWQSVSLVIEGYDNTFPLVTEGCEPLIASLEMDIVQLPEGGYREVIKGVHMS